MLELFTLGDSQEILESVYIEVVLVRVRVRFRVRVMARVFIFVVMLMFVNFLLYFLWGEEISKLDELFYFFRNFF
jgi:hypothetical protein